VVPLTVRLVCLLCVCAVASSYAQQPPAIRVRLDFDEGSGMAAARQMAAVAEAAELWKPYGVFVFAGTAVACDTRLTITTREHRPQDRGGDLGSVRFGADGIPDPRIVLHYATVVQLATGTAAFGISAREWPVRLREEVIARAVGRTLAHEIGHYLLQSPHHAGSGLMRSRHRATALASPQRSEFALTAADVARLKIVTAAGVLSAHGVQATSTVDPACGTEQRADASTTLRTP
jgi:hypothetical protein